MKRWQAPPGSVVHGSARRLDPRRVARVYGATMSGLAVVSIAIAFHWAGDRRIESPYQELQRGADMAPYVVVAVLGALMFAGTTKRIFGFGRAGALGCAIAAMCLVAGSWCVARFGVPGVACAALLGLVGGIGTTRVGAGPWLTYAAFAATLVLGARLGFALSGLPQGVEGDGLAAAAALAGGSAFGLWPLLRRIMGGSGSLP